MMVATISGRMDFVVSDNRDVRQYGKFLVENIW